MPVKSSHSRKATTYFSLDWGGGGGEGFRVPFFRERGLRGGGGGGCPRVSAHNLGVFRTFGVSGLGASGAEAGLELPPT